MNEPMSSAEGPQCRICGHATEPARRLWQVRWEGQVVWLCQEHLDLVRGVQEPDEEQLAAVKEQLREELLPLLLEAMHDGTLNLPEPSEPSEPSSPMGRTCSVCLRGDEPGLPLVEQTISGEVVLLCPEHDWAVRSRAQREGCAREEALNYVRRVVLDAFLGTEDD